MLDVQLGELTAAGPAGVAEALGLVAGFDQALALGFARVGEEPAAALAALAGALAGSPLGDRAGEAVERWSRAPSATSTWPRWPAWRAALTGAAHDALLARLDAALAGPAPLGRARRARGRPAGQPAGGRPRLAAELAITGWRGVDHDVVTPSDRTVEALLGVPALRGLAVLLDGLAAELRASCPVSAMDLLPARRWADLWARGLLLARSGPWHGTPEPVSGRLLVLGADVHEHATVVRVQVHGVLEPAGGGPARLVRAGVAAAKVDTITGPAVWRLLAGHPVLLGALAGHHALDLAGMPLLPGGDLVWHDDLARAGEAADPFTTARVLLGAAQAPPVPPLDRHPVRIAEPVLVEHYRVDGETLELGGNRLALDLDRLPSCTPLTPELVAASSTCLGLLRWDGGRWLLQPLAVQATVQKKPVTAHTGDWALGPADPKVVKAEARAGDPVAVLRERAGRLLRK
ncbi:hypothetical protein MF672_040905 [Actinomadura sp. ATCC 31491]|uniref:Uncharacterized protein n=1 Tax=Actinomadura luzonensis TaxID=2805427 RepID=A0ABT0G6V4_9ACTN|nr:hypothetical protein [Actinomadura luzonensis]MCK2220113.1 hypothetical protein [Actinomadura luzonensis]